MMLLLKEVAISREIISFDAHIKSLVDIFGHNITGGTILGRPGGLGLRPLGLGGWAAQQRCTLEMILTRETLWGIDRRLIEGQKVTAGGYNKRYGDSTQHVTTEFHPGPLLSWARPPTSPGWHCALRRSCQWEAWRHKAVDSTLREIIKIKG